MVVGITMVRDEEDIVAFTVLNMLEQCDAVLVADNGSTDRTRSELDGIAYLGDLTVIDDPEVGYFQGRKMSTLAARAARMGADWVVPFDADEIWYSPFGRIADVLTDRPEAIATAELYDHVATAEDPAHPNPVRRIGWRRTHPAPLQKVAVRPSLPVTIHQGNHGASFPAGQVDGLLVVRHFPYRSPEQTARKVRNGAAAYAATDLPEDMGDHWRGWGRILSEHGEEAIHDMFRKWHWRADPRAPVVIDGESQEPLMFDPAPDCPPLPQS